MPPSAAVRPPLLAAAAAAAAHRRRRHCVQGSASMPPRRRRQQAAAQAVSEASLAGLPPDVLQVGKQGSVVALLALLPLWPPHVQPCAARYCPALCTPSADHWRPPGGSGQAVQPRNCSPGHRVPGHDLTVRAAAAARPVAFLTSALPAWWRDASMLHMSAPCRCPAQQQHLLHGVAQHGKGRPALSAPPLVAFRQCTAAPALPFSHPSCPCFDPPNAMQCAQRHCQEHAVGPAGRGVPRGGDHHRQGAGNRAQAGAGW